MSLRGRSNVLTEKNVPEGDFRRAFLRGGEVFRNAEDKGID